jgi:hypothetical protein
MVAHLIQMAIHWYYPKEWGELQKDSLTGKKCPPKPKSPPRDALVIKEGEIKVVREFPNPIKSPPQNKKEVKNERLNMEL